LVPTNVAAKEARGRANLAVVQAFVEAMNIHYIRKRAINTTATEDGLGSYDVATRVQESGWETLGRAIARITRERLRRRQNTCAMPRETENYNCCTMEMT